MRTTNIESRSASTSHNQLKPVNYQKERLPQNEANNEAVVTPELLVDALSGHEDGLLAIAERLMEHYESGYDVMGEAIIDAFADVQKLFQHVVEAAHMEGAAFEASRREAEGEKEEYVVSPNGPIRHDEFVDEDVRVILADAAKLGQAKKEAGQYVECYELYEEACNSASALLPVDSDHRGRLQLSIARAESMSPERACAILKYAMDDVLRSGKNIRPMETSKRSDCVLQKDQKSLQSNEEILASLVQEMKEVSSAPMYADSPIQEVAARFWVALSDVQKQSSKNEERLEQSLGKLKADFLLARAEWEEKLSEATQTAEDYRKKYLALQEMNQSISPPLTSRSMDYSEHTYTPQRPNKAPSVVSIGSGIAYHAKSLVGSFSCGMGGSSADRTSPTHFKDNQHVPGVSFTSSNDSNSRSSSNKQFMYHHQASI